MTLMQRVELNSHLTHLNDTLNKVNSIKSSEFPIDYL